jgi:hypothetical protein
MSPRLLATAAALALVVAACDSSSSPQKAATPAPTEVSPAGDIPDNQAFVTFQAPGSPYAVKVPEGWSQTRQGGAIVFTDKLNSIELAWGAAPKPAPGAAKVSTVKRTAGGAERATYDERSQPDAVTGKTRTNTVERYVFTRGGKYAILTLSGPKGADNVDPWRIVTDSLRWTA